MTGVKELFAEFSGEDVDWFQMQFYFERMADRRCEYQRRHAQTAKWKETKARWLARQPKRERTRRVDAGAAKERKQRWEAKDPAHARAIRLAAQKRWRAKNIERIRAEDRARKKKETA